jgi:serine phosphatase RsbU (regulator of sigma subunit)
VTERVAPVRREKSAGPQTHGVGDMLRELDHAPPTDLVEVCSRWLSVNFGAMSCVLLLADYAEMSLEPVTDSAAGRAEPAHDVLNSQAGLAYREQRRVHDGIPAGSTRQTVHLPVSIRAERLGVLTVALPGTSLRADVAEALDDVARMLAYVLTGARRYTDRFEMMRRRRELGLAAEIQWELLPSLAYSLPGFSIAGALEPAYEIGGDNFDYAVSAHRLTVSITDGTGHGVRAAIIASLACTAMRNARRASELIVAQAEAANRHIAEQFPGPEFVTGLLLDLDVHTGAGTIVNAGHPLPLLLRGGAISEIEIPPQLPLGLRRATTYPVHTFRLEPGDRVLLITDGVPEAHRPGRPLFGEDRVVDMLLTRSDLPAAEFVRTLTRAVAEYCDGRLADDATAVCLDWRPALTTNR